MGTKENCMSYLYIQYPVVGSLCCQKGRGSTLSVQLSDIKLTLANHRHQ